MKSVFRLTAVAIATSPIVFTSVSSAALTPAQYSGFSSAASSTSGNVITDTNGGTGYTFSGTSGMSYNYGSLGSSGSTVMYLLNLSPVGSVSTAVGQVPDSNTGGFDSLKFEQYDATGNLGITQPGIADYTLSGAASPYSQDALLTFVNKADGSVEFYVNSTDEGNIGGSFKITGGSGNLGSGSSLTTDTVTGTIYGIATFSGALSTSQISSIYSAESSPTTPEPASLSLLGFGAVGLLARRHRNRA